MLLALLIRNYYEIHGTFKDIQFTSIGPQIIAAAEDAQISLEEFCYRALLYRPIENYSALEVCEMRREAILGNFPKLTRKALNAAVKTKDANYKICKLNKMKKDFGVDNDVFMVCYAYYKNCFHGYYKIEDDYMDFYHTMNFIRTKPKKLEIVWNSLNTEKAILTYSKTNTKGVVVTNNRVCASKELTHDFEEINKNAFTCALFGLTVDLSVATKKYGELALLSISNPSLYTMLLDIANACKITYAALMDEIDFKVNDQFIAYDTYNCIVLDVESTGHALVVTAENTIDKPFSRRLIA